MPLGKFTKTPVEAKRYAIEYDEWLDTGEYISDVTFETISENSGQLVIVADALASQAKQLLFFVAGGDDGQTYRVAVTMTTTGNQVKQDTVIYAVRAL